MDPEIDLLISEANNTDWQFLVKRKYGLLINSLFWSGLNRGCYLNAIGREFEHKKGFYFDMDWNVDKKEYEQESSLVQKMDSADPHALKTLANRCYELGNELMEFSREISKVNYSGKSTEELIGLFEEYARKLDAFMPFLMFTHPVADYLETYSREKLRASLAGKDRLEILEDVCTVFFSPIRQNDVSMERIDLLKLAMAKKSGPETQSLLDHQDKYGWFPTRDGITEPTSIKEYESRLSSIENPEKELKKIIEFRNNNEKQYEKFLTELGIDEEFKKKIKTAREYVYLRTYRTDRIHHSFCEIRPLLIEIGKRFGLDYVEVAHLTKEEISSLNRGLPSRERIKERIMDYGYLVLGGRMHVFSGDALDRFRQGYQSDRIHRLTELKGNPASPGKIVGKVKVVLTNQEIGKVGEGDVLVASMTTPDYVPAMSKAAALVTDEGGITCHAAIIAREMKKPCVIATKFATKLLKDGDMVEVNADKGEVRILS